jgi:protocatechuate 3,4-dioxygenase alpha subunit
VAAKPAPVPWPGGGTQAPHLELGIFARGLLKRVVTRMYFPAEVEANAADPVLLAVDPERRGTLVAVPAGPGALRFDIRLQGDGETVFFRL